MVIVEGIYNYIPFIETGDYEQCNVYIPVLWRRVVG